MRRYRYRVTFTERDLGSFLDMLRYDGSTVEGWDHATPPPSATLSGRHVPTFTVTLSSERPPTVERWQSFGLTATVLP